MIRNRLAELLAERGIRISKVANDIPNLSRNTISATAQNESKMIQLETINSLCQYLEISPNDFFEYLPFDVSTNISEIQPLKIVNAGKDNEPIGATLSIFDYDLFISVSKKLANIATNKTFDLTIRMENKLELTIDDPSSSSSIDDATQTITLNVYLGNSQNKQAYGDEEKQFFDFWNNQLTPGFRSLLMKDIEKKYHDAFIDNIKNKSANLNLVWDIKSMYFNFILEDAYTDKDTSEPIIKMDYLPF